MRAKLEKILGDVEKAAEEAWFAFETCGNVSEVGYFEGLAEGLLRAYDMIEKEIKENED